MATKRGSRAGFDKVPSAAWDHFAEIGPGGYALLGALASHADKQGRCFPSVARVAQMVNCSDRHARRLLQVLENCGLLAITRRPGRSSLYELSYTPDMSVTPDTGVTPQQSQPRTPTAVPPDTHVRGPRTPMSPKPDRREPDLTQPEVSTEFEEFWRAYPRKVAKGEAAKAWKQTAKQRPRLTDLIASLERLKRSAQWTEKGGKFIPYAATWLRREGWLDELPEEPPNSRTAGSDDDRAAALKEVGETWTPKAVSQ